MQTKGVIFAVVLVTTLVIVKATPINLFDLMIDSSEDQFLSRLVDYFNGDASESSSSVVRAPASSVGSNRSADCKLPMKRGMCRALLPRWR